MRKQIEPTHTIEVEQQVYSVEKLPPKVQEMVEFMDEWRQREAELVSELTMCSSALRDIKNNIYAAIVHEQQEAAMKAANAAQFTEPEVLHPQQD